MGGVNFVRALREASVAVGRKIFIVGTEYNTFHAHFPELDVSVRTPAHSDPDFLKTLLKVVREYRPDFIHPSPSSEAKVISGALDEFTNLHVHSLLPSEDSIAPDKDVIFERLSSAGVSVPDTRRLADIEDVKRAFLELGSPLWLRPKRGAGARLSLRVDTAEQAELWIRLNVLQGRAKLDEFILQSYLPGRDLAFDSLWLHGRLVTSSARERLEYPFKHISLTGLTGTPSVARTISEEAVNSVGTEAVIRLDAEPNGFYSVDIKEDGAGKLFVTEVDGKWHTTAPLWGYACSKVSRDVLQNIAYDYLLLGLGEELSQIPQYDLYQEGLYLIRQMDSGVVLLDGKTGRSWRVV